MSPEAATNKRTVISHLSSLPTTATCLAPSFSIVRLLTGTNFDPVWSQLMMRASGMDEASNAGLTCIKRFVCREGCQG